MEPVRKILLATDLSARSDRAMDRAMVLMREWSAELVVLHVLERDTAGHPSPRVRPDPALEATVRRQLYSDLRSAGGRGTLRIEEGDVVGAIRRVAAEEGCGLIVTGVARNEVFGRFTLGATVDGLLRTSTVPVLLVTERARAPYQNIVVAIDFSDDSRRAFEAAVRLFPTQRLTLFHAYDAPGSYAAGDIEEHRAQFGLIAQRRYAEFLEAAQVPEDARARIDARIEWGNPHVLIGELARRTGVDLVVLGTSGPGRVLEFFVGSVAKQIVAHLSCDALVLRA